MNGTRVSKCACASAVVSVKSVWKQCDVNETVSEQHVR